MRDKSEWQRVRWGDVVRLNTDRCADPAAAGIERYIGLEHLEPGDLTVRTWGDVADGTTFTNRVRPGQVLFGKRRAYQRKVALATFDAICSSDIYVFESKDPGILLPELLPYLCQTERFYEHAVGTSAGSLSPRTNWTQLSTYEFALPPLDEQRRIAEVLEACDAHVESLRESVRCSDKLLWSLTDHQLSTCLKKVPLGEILHETAYGCSVKSHSEPVGTPIVGIPHVLRGVLSMVNLPYVTLSKSETDRYSVQEGDILVVRTNGNPDYVGRCVVVPKLTSQLVYASYLIRLRVKTGCTHSEYVTLMLNSPSMRRVMRGDIRSSAGNFNINTGGLSRQVIALPPIEAQLDFLSLTRRIRSASDATHTTIAQSVGFKASLLRQLE